MRCTAHPARGVGLTRLAPTSRLTVTSVCKSHRVDQGGNASKQLISKLCGIGAAAVVLLGGAGNSLASGEKVGDFATSGFIPVPGVFRDTVQVFELTDPEVDGVTLYYTDYSRSLQERIAADPFSDPSQASITCVATGAVTVKNPDAIRGLEGRELLSELKTLNLLSNKRTILRRIYDEKHQAVIYVAYSTRFTSTSVSR